MKIAIAILIGASIVLLYKYGPEVMQFNTYRVYQEIQILKDRVSSLENR